MFDAEAYRRNHHEGKKCKHCGAEFYPEYAAQQYCSREDNPYCDDDRISKRLWDAGKHPLQTERKTNEQ